MFESMAEQEYHYPHYLLSQKIELLSFYSQTLIASESTKVLSVSQHNRNVFSKCKINCQRTSEKEINYPSHLFGTLNSNLGGIILIFF